VKILLVWPKARTDPEWGGDLGAVAEPLALEYLAAAGKQAGHEVRVLDLRLHPGALDEQLTSFEPDLVGVTAFSMHVSAALAVCARAKEVLGCQTIAGGHHATFLPEDFFKPQVDFVVSGEGVAPFRELLERLGAQEPPTGIPGLWYRQEGEFTLGAAPSAFDVDSLPVPDRSVTAADRNSYFIDWMKPVALLRSTVGCPYRCTFCSLWKLMGGKYYARDISAVVAELGDVDEEFVFLIDDEAFINGPRMLKLAEAIEQAGIRKRLFAYCRIDTLLRNRHVLAKWREIGLERLLVGIDAISGKDLDEYNKKLKISQVEDGIKAASELGIGLLAQFVINTDYQRRDFRRLQRFVEHHKLAYPTFTVLTPLPGTELLTDMNVVIERQANGRPNWDLFDTQNAVTRTVLPKDEFRAEYRNLFHRFHGAYLQYVAYHSNPAGSALGPAPDLGVGVKIGRVHAG